MAGNVLIVDDDQVACNLLVEAMLRRGYTPAAASTVQGALALLVERDFDVVVTDLRLPGMDGLTLCERIVANRPNVPVIVMTGHGCLETAVAAIRAGAYDFLVKPFEVERLRLMLDRALEHRSLQREVRRLQQVSLDGQGFDDMIGTSLPLERVKEFVVRVAESSANLLITGESGSGKELVANAVHRRSKSGAGPFVAINCAAMPEALLESELFGHVKGAFTDARSARPGLFLKANGGTLFLDEIGELPLGMQPKLLRALQEHMVRPVGGDREEPFDARIITATNRDLEAEVRERRFREDLYYRINVVRIDVPPLRARGFDVLLLAQHFVEQMAAQTGKPVKGLSTPVAQKLMHYDWPGNVRELRNCIERAIALTSFEELTVDDLPDKISDYQPSSRFIPGLDGEELLPMDEVERRYVLRVLKQVGWSKTLAAEVLGFDRRTLYRKLERWNIHAAEHRSPQPEDKA